MKPGMMGFPYVKKFGRQFLKFLRNYNVEATCEFCAGFSSEEEAFRFVRESIDSKNPVALLILFHRADSLKEDNWHWVTVTGYTADEASGLADEIIMSNCGERQIVKAAELFEVHKRNTIRMVRFKLQTLG